MPHRFLHGIEVLETNTSGRAYAPDNASIIGIIGDDDAKDSPFRENVPHLVRKSDLEKVGPGSIKNAIEAILHQTRNATIIVVTVPKSDDMKTVIGDATKKTGVYAFLNAHVHCDGLSPTIVIAPGASAHPEVATALTSVADTLRAMAIVDTPDTVDGAKLAAKTIASSRVMAVFPSVRKGELTVPLSPYVAGVMARVDHDNGFWNSISNQKINGITGLSHAVDCNMHAADSTANQLNAANITTVINQGGFRLWGNRSTAGTTDQWSFITVRRTADVIHNQLVNAHLWAVDKNITRAYVDEVAERVNGYLRALTTKGAIAGGICAVDKDTRTSWARGHVCFKLSFTPPYPAERLTFAVTLTDDYIKDMYT